MARNPITLMQLLAVLRGQVEILEQRGDVNLPVHAITDDSRAVTAGSLFVAVKGERVDGHRFVEQAIKAGAVAVVAQTAVASGPVPFVGVADSRKALGLLGSRFHGDPSAHLKMIGVTGTNGKTTTTYLCKSLLEGIGRRVGLIGTVGYQIGQETIPASHTTPGALDLQALLAKMVDGGLNAAVMEVSSHALALDRTAGCEYDVAVFTNLTQDHLDFHHTMDEYFEAKLRLFTGLAGGKKTGKRAIVNLDDPRGVRSEQPALCRLGAMPLRTRPISRRNECVSPLPGPLLPRQLQRDRLRSRAGWSGSTTSITYWERLEWRCIVERHPIRSAKRPPRLPMSLVASSGSVPGKILPSSSIMPIQRMRFSVC